LNETPLSIYVLKFQILLKPPESLFLKESLSLGSGLRKLLVLFKFELVDVRVFWQSGQDTQRVILLSSQVGERFLFHLEVVTARLILPEVDGSL
jgi:hypothetical protein